MCSYNDVAVGIHKFKDSVRTILMIYKFTLYIRDGNQNVLLWEIHSPLAEKYQKSWLGVNIVGICALSAYTYTYKRQTTKMPTNFNTFSKM